MMARSQIGAWERANKEKSGRAHRFAAPLRDQCHEGVDIDRLAEEPNRAIGKSDVGAAHVDVFFPSGSVPVTVMRLSELAQIGPVLKAIGTHAPPV